MFSFCTRLTRHVAAVHVSRVQGEGPGTSGPRPTVKRLILVVFYCFSCKNIHLFKALVIVTSGNWPR